MKQLSILLVFLSGMNVMVFSQQFIEKEKQVEVLETTEVETRKTSIGLAGGIVQYFGEYTSEMGLDYGLLIRSHINNKFDITYNFHLGDVVYKDSADLTQTTSYFGANSLFKLNLIETFTKSEQPKLISPYVGAGVGALISQAPHYTINQYVDFYFPVAAGVDINVSDNFIVGLNATGRILFSDEWDNNQTSGGNDILFNPSLSLKYVIGKRKKSKQQYVTKTIKYKEEIAEKDKFEKYEEKEIESFVEISVKEIRDSSVVTSQVDPVVTEEVMDDNTVVTNVSVNESEENTTSVTVNTTEEENTNQQVEEEKEETGSSNYSNDNYLFYTIQIGTYPSRGYETRGTHHDFEFYNSVLNKYNYCKGFFASYNEAQRELNNIKAQGDNGFVVAIYKEERLKGYNADRLVESGEVRVDTEAAKDKYLK